MSPPRGSSTATSVAVATYEGGALPRTAEVASWAALADRTPCSPFVRPEWLLPWWSAFGHGQLELLGVHDGDRLAASLAVRRHRRRVDSPTNWHTPVYGFLSAGSAWTRHLATELFDPRPRRVVLDLLDAADPALGDVVAVAESLDYWVEVRERQRAVVIDTRGDWDAYHSTLPRELRKNLRRRQRRLDEMGRVEVDVRDGREDLDALLTEGFVIEASGWKGERGTAMSSRPETSRFYREFAGLAAERGWLRLSFLRVGGHAIAFNYGIQLDDVHYAIKTGYDQRAASFSPGLLLHHAALRRAFDTSVTRYELLGSDDAWKQPWASDYRSHVRARAITKSTSTAIERWARGSDAVAARGLRRGARSVTSRRLG